MKHTLSALWLALLLTLSQLGMAQNPPAGFTSTVVSTGWNEAVGLTFTSSGSQMFVWERPGKVWVVTNGQRQLVLDISEEVGAWDDHGLIGFALDPQFDANGYMYLLYVVDRHYLINFGTPAYNPATNDYNSATIGRLTRYTATPSGNGYTVNLASRKILLGATKTTGIPSTAGGHVTGALAFGTDGTLLVSTGDGAHWAPDLGSSNETSYAQALADGIITSKENVGALRSQLVNNLNGKILRLDPATGAGVPSNPFYDASNPNAPRSKVWALGFRNPFRMTVKPGTGSPDPAAANPGTLYIGNVGGSYWEEVELVDRPRQNMGWPLFEGLTPNDAFATSNVYNQDAPNPQYGIGGCTQQYFYFRDLLKQETPTGTASFTTPCDNTKAIPSTVPTFVHSRPLIDWGHGTGPSRTGIFSGSTATTINIGAAGSPVAGPQFGGNSASGGVFYPYTDWPAAYQNTYFFGDYVGGWIRSMTVDASNKPSLVRDFVDSGAVPVAMAVSPSETGLFYVNFYPSEIRKLSYITAATPPKAVASANKTYGPGPLAVQFTGSASSDPSGSPLTYQWNFGDGGSSTATNPAHTFAPPTNDVTNYTVTLTVRNSSGLTNQTTLVVSVNNTPPQVTITSPAADVRYPMTGNTTYDLRATVTDTEHSAAQLSYQWQTILHHGVHQHPDPVDTNVETTTTIEPYGCGSETYYYVIQLTVTDAAGLATTQQVRLDPDCTTTTFTLVDADSNEDIQAVVNGAVLNLATLPTRNLNIRANVNAATTGSVVFALTGTQTQSQTDSGFPYALFGDVNGVYNAWAPLVGNYSLTATPYSDANGSGVAAPVLMANFSVIDQLPAGFYTLTATAGSNGSVSKSPDQSSYATGSVVTLTATPAAGYQFAGWSGDATGTTNPLSVTMTGNKAITATFSAIPPTTYVLTTATVGSGTVTKNPNAASYASGTVVSLTATPAAGYTFSGWSGAATGTTNPLSVTMSANKTITATFTATPTTYTLTTPVVGSGTVTRNPNATSYASGTVVSLTATPASGYTFSGWSGAATGTANPLSVTMSADKSITATFTATPAGQSVASFTLVNADTDTDIQPLTTGATLNLATLPTKNLNIRANTSPATVGSVVFALTGSQTQNQTEGIAPYALFSDAGGDYNPWTPAVGSYSLTARPYSAASGGGTAGTALTISFSVINQATGPFTLTTAVVGSGTVTKNPDAASYTAGTVVTLTATPAAGYTFSGWSGAATGTTNPLSVTMSANKSITATFTAIPTGGPYTLTTATVGSGTVTKNPNAASYASGTVVSLTAAPASGYTFSGWSGDASGTTNPLSVTMSANKNITATFTAVPAGQSVSSFTLVNADTDQDIQALTAGAVLNLATLPTKNLNIRANTNPATVGSVVFALSGVQTQNQTEGIAPYALFSDAGGDYNPWTPPVGSYSLTARPYSAASGGGTAGTALTISFSVINQATGPFTLTTAVVGSGTVTKNPDAASYAAGTVVTLTATPAAGYTFSGWSGAATGTTNPLSVTMSANKTITATFTATPTTTYTLTTSVVGSGSVSKSPDQSSYATGSVVTLTATPAAGYQFAGWGGDATGTANPLSVTMTGNKTITATFTTVPAATFTLTTATVGSGTITKDPNAASYASGTVVSLTAAPASGYTFSGWSGDASGTTNPLSVTMSANKSITATFTATPSGTTFYRAVNINGGAIVLDGQNWVGSSGAASFQTTGPLFANQTIALSPATDATRAGMIRSSVYGPSVTATMSSVPAGTYSVYLYVWEDNKAEIYTIRLEGQIVQANYNSGAAGHWERLGPYTAAITDGAINIAFSGGWANLSGMEVWRQNTAAKATASTATATAPTAPDLGSTTASRPARVYPNPSGTGRYQVVLPEPVVGDLTYTLLSATGARLVQGQRHGGSQRLDFHFEQEITAPGLYYLLLEGSAGLHARLKLLRE